MRTQELNLLMIFDAIMTENSISRAAKRLSLSQPAVSNAVARMRHVWKDELFLKDGRGIRPTSYARNLWLDIRLPLTELANVIDPQEFDPSTAKRTFRVALSDSIVQLAWLEMRKLIEREAPNISLHAHPYQIQKTEQFLMDAEVDLVIGGGFTPTNNIQAEYLFEPKFVMITRPDHPLAKPEITPEEFVSAEHLLVSLSGEASGIVDQTLAQMNLTRRIAMIVNHFTCVANIIKDSNLVAVLPSTAVEKEILNGELAVTKVPFAIDARAVSSYWHKRQEKDLGLCWLRQHLTRLIKDDVAKHNELLLKKFCQAQ